MKNRSLPAAPAPIPLQPELSAPDTRNTPTRTLRTRVSVQSLAGLLLACAALGLTSCHSAAYYYYKFPSTTFAGRPVPPSKLAQRVMIGMTFNGAIGSLQIVDASRDIRSNVENTIPSFAISGYGEGFPDMILNFPVEQRGYVYSASDGSLTNVDYTTEGAVGAAGTFQPGQASVAIPPAFSRIYGTEETAGFIKLIDNLSNISYSINIPNVYHVAVNQGDTVTLFMVRNSNTLYRLFKLNQNQYLSNQAAAAATGSVDCEPAVQPVYCIVPVPGTFDRPVGVYFSLDGTTAYVLNCGPECGGTTASVTLLQQGPLNNNVIPTSPVQPNPQIANVPVPGGATAALSDGITLYIAGQQLQPDGLFEGFLSTMSQATNTITGKYPISDGTHTKILFADNNTLWIGSQSCATGEHQKQSVNYNCLTRVDLGKFTACPQTVFPLNSTPASCPQIVPNVTPGNASATVPYPNQNLNQWYYGDLTGLCWVQNFNKVYTAYGGQVHIFSTVDGSEIDNSLVAVQGTALDVAYMDALSDDAN